MFMQGAKVKADAELKAVAVNIEKQAEIIFR